MSRPPYRADHVGSLLRPAALQDARTKFEQGAITAADLGEIEDREIEAVVKTQEEIGLKLATDGEFRRAVWSYDFLERLDGVEGYRGEGVQFKGVVSVPQSVRVVGKVGFPGNHPMLDHFRFLKAHTNVTPKMTIPAPAVLHFRIGQGNIDRSVYADDEQLFDDLADAYRAAVRAFYDAGCRYLQLDDTVWSYLCSENEREKARQRGLDPDRLPDLYARATNHAIGDRPSDMTMTMHVCRGNFRSAWVSEGGYEPMAEVLLGSLGYDGFFLEYDTDRAGGFEPLRFLPRGGQRAVLGLITSKSGELETKDAVKRRIEEATQYADLGQLCLSPQCGFASTREGNILTEDQQWAKLRMIAEIADEVWGNS
jgi:5-methyltetrahydropteroyltriglutamate--homocysteine methyltransferase